MMTVRAAAWPIGLGRAPEDDRCGRPADDRRADGPDGAGGRHQRAHRGSEGGRYDRPAKTSSRAAKPSEGVVEEVREAL